MQPLSYSVFRIQLLIICVFCCMVNTLMAQTEKKEADLKAVFIYNFTKYTEWDTQDKGSTTFVIGVIGQSPVTPVLMQIALSKTVNGKRMVVQQFASPEDITACQLLFIPAGLPYSLSSVLDKVDRGVLTVSEQEGYALRGTAFNFITAGDKLRFEANLKAIDQAGLKVSSQLLKLAVIVN